MQGVSKAIFATSADDLRPVMTGIFIEIAQGKVKFVASDGHKLVCYTRADVSSDSESSFILPKKPATLLKNILSKADTQVQLAFDKKNAVIEFGDFKLLQATSIRAEHGAHTSVWRCWLWFMSALADSARR